MLRVVWVMLLSAIGRGVVLSLLLLHACDCFAVAVRDDLGRLVSLKKPPTRIVSLAPSATEILFAIGAGDAVVAVDESSDYPPQVRRLPKVGAFMRPSIEAIVKHHPHLIVLASNVLPKGEVEALESKLLVPIFAIVPKRVVDIISAIERLGKLVGKEGEARAVAGKMRLELERLSKLKTSRKVSVFVEVSPPPSLMGVGVNNFIDDAIELAGGENVLRRAGLPSEFPTVSLERLMVLNPDVYIVAVHGRLNRSAVSEVKRRVGFQQLRAVRAGRVYAIDADILFRPGPRIIQGIKTLRRLLHGNVAGEL
jgi:iron complex transport system substrate-binding protein